VMSGDTPLSRAHDLSQHLQDKIELLPGVARAFVHVDHETTHRPVSRLLPFCSYPLTRLTGASKAKILIRLAVAFNEAHDTKYE
jgi:hypothetical protein